MFQKADCYFPISSPSCSTNSIVGLQSPEQFWGTALMSQNELEKMKQGALRTMSTESGGYWKHSPNFTELDCFIHSLTYELIIGTDKSTFATVDALLSICQGWVAGRWVLMYLSWDACLSFSRCFEGWPSLFLLDCDLLTKDAWFEARLWLWARYALKSQEHRQQAYLTLWEYIRGTQWVDRHYPYDVTDAAISDGLYSMICSSFCHGIADCFCNLPHISSINLASTIAKESTHRLVRGLIDIMCSLAVGIPPTDARWKLIALLWKPIALIMYCQGVVRFGTYKDMLSLVTHGRILWFSEVKDTFCNIVRARRFFKPYPTSNLDLVLPGKTFSEDTGVETRVAMQRLGILTFTLAQSLATV